MTYSCRLFSLAALAALFAVETSLAQPSTQPTGSNPILVVRTRTDIENQGAPTLDIVDLERYFVTKLAERGIENALPSKAARILRPPAPNTYLAVLSVEAMHVAERPVWNNNNTYSVHTIFGADLSLTLKELKTGNVLGTVRSDAEHYIFQWTDGAIADKRVAIYAAADRLADHFVESTKKGAFGNEVKSLLPPPPPRPGQTSVEGFIRWIRTGGHAWYVLGGVTMSVGLLFILGVGAGGDSGSTRPVPSEPKSSPSPKHIRDILGVGAGGDSGSTRPVPSKPKWSPPPKHIREKWDERLKQALALSLSTNNFSTAACWDTAHDGLDEILKRREAIEEAEAERRLNSKKREAEYAEIAACGAATSHFDQAALIEILRNADEWEYRVLREAENQNERRQNEPTATTK